MGRPRAFEEREAIAKATAVFHRRGYAATTPQQLAEATGLGRGSLYNAFTSKHGLFERALAHYAEGESRQLLAILDGSGSPKRRILAVLLEIVELDLRERRGCLAVNTVTELGATDDGVGALVAGLFDRTERAFLRVLEEGQAVGEIPTKIDARKLASLLLAVVTGLRVLGRLEKRSPRRRRVIDALGALL